MEFNLTTFVLGTALSLFLLPLRLSTGDLLLLRLVASDGVGCVLLGLLGPVRSLLGLLLGFLTGGGSDRWRRDCGGACRRREMRPRASERERGGRREDLPHSGQKRVSGEMKDPHSPQNAMGTMELIMADPLPFSEEIYQNTHMVHFGFLENWNLDSCT